MTIHRWMIRSGMAAFLLFSGTAFGQDVAQAAQEQAPDHAIREATEELQTLIQQNRAQYQSDRQKFYAMVDEVVVPRFDTHLIGRVVLGRHWRSATPQQRERFIEAFKNSLVHSYADALLRYADSISANWQPQRAADGEDHAEVRAELIRESGPPVPIVFAVRQVDGEWKIYDVTVEGISLAITFRSQFNAEIKQNGLDALIARLENGEEPMKGDALGNDASRS